jgi:histone acetyltransferase (RNA polymerase elongator complex component)
MENTQNITKQIELSDITINLINKYEKFLDQYYNNTKDKSDVREEFIKYQNDNNMNAYKFQILSWVYKVGKHSKRFIESDYELESILKIKNLYDNSGIMVFNIDTISQVDPIEQMVLKLRQYIKDYFPINKIEICIYGNIFDKKMKDTKNNFIRDIYYFINNIYSFVFYNKNNEYVNNPTSIEILNRFLRPKLSLEEEIKLNENSYSRIVDLSIETKPYFVTHTNVVYLKKIGCTRIQINSVHMNDQILTYNKYSFAHKETIKAIQLAKNNGFKIDVNLILDLDYTSNIEQLDRLLLEEFNSNPDLKVDCIKLQPSKTNNTNSYGQFKPIELHILRKMSKEDKYNLKMSNPMYKNIFDIYTNAHKSIKIIISNEFNGITAKYSMRNDLFKDIEDLNINLSGLHNYNHNHNNDDTELADNIPILKELAFESAEGMEYFISYETNNIKPNLYGFVRLFLSAHSGKTALKSVIFPQLLNTALIREVNIYNKGSNINYIDQLIERAENIAASNGFNKILINSSAGMREYYNYKGYIPDIKYNRLQFKSLEDKVVHNNNYNIINNILIKDNNLIKDKNTKFLKEMINFGKEDLSKNDNNDNDNDNDNDEYIYKNTDTCLFEIIISMIFAIYYLNFL